MFKPSLAGNEAIKIRAKRSINQPTGRGGLNYTRRSRIFNYYYPRPPWPIPVLHYYNVGKPWYELETLFERYKKLYAAGSIDQPTIVDVFGAQAQHWLKYGFPNENNKNNGTQLSLF